MPDFLDRASEHEIQSLADNLAAQAARAAKAARPTPTGVCLNPHCAEEFPAGDSRLYCNSGCAASHQRFSTN